MADLNREQMRRYALLGARARLDEIREEEASIRRAFPELARGAGRRAAAGAEAGGEAPKGRKKRRKPKMSAAQRKAVGERMRKYWAERRKARAG